MNKCSSCGNGDGTAYCMFCYDNNFYEGRKQGAVDLADKIKRKLFEEENLYKNLYFKRKDICEIVNKELEGV